MVVRPLTSEVKQLVLRNFLDLGVPSAELFGLKETILVQGDQCMARAYRAGSHRAIWSTDEGTVKFYDDTGRLLRVVNLLSKKVPQLIAA